MSKLGVSYQLFWKLIVPNSSSTVHSWTKSLLQGGTLPMPCEGRSHDDWRGMGGYLSPFSGVRRSGARWRLFTVLSRLAGLDERQAWLAHWHGTIIFGILLCLESFFSWHEPLFEMIYSLIRNPTSIFDPLRLRKPLLVVSSLAVLWLLLIVCGYRVLKFDFCTSSGI